MQDDMMQKFYINDTKFYITVTTYPLYVWKEIQRNMGEIGVTINCPDCNEFYLFPWCNENGESCFICEDCGAIYYLADSQGNLLTDEYVEDENGGDGSQYFLQKADAGITFTLDGVSYTVDEGTTWGEFMSVCPICGSTGMYHWQYYHYMYSCDKCGGNGNIYEDENDKQDILPDELITEGTFHWMSY